MVQRICLPSLFPPQDSAHLDLPISTWYLWVFQGFPYSSKSILFKSFSIVPSAKIPNLGQHQNKWTICWEGTLEVFPAQPSCLAAVAIAPGQQQPTYLPCVSTLGTWLLDLVRLIHLFLPKAIFCAGALKPLYEVGAAVASKRGIFSRTAQNSFAVRQVSVEGRMRLRYFINHI